MSTRTPSPRGVLGLSAIALVAIATALVASRGPAVADNPKDLRTFPNSEMMQALAGGPKLVGGPGVVDLHAEVADDAPMPLWQNADTASEAGVVLTVINDGDCVLRIQAPGFDENVPAKTSRAMSVRVPSGKAITWVATERAQRRCRFFWAVRRP